MKQIIFVFTLLIVILTLALTLRDVRAQYTYRPVVSELNLTTYEVVGKKLDPKAEVLTAYFAKHNSPLQNHAQDFIDAANTYDLDWRLVAAISGVESTFGKRIPGGYNGWGWGVYGTNRIYFTSWRDGIFTVSKGLKEDYISRGLTDPYSMNRRYAASQSWGKNVTFFMNDLERFANAYEAQKVSNIVSVPETQIAAPSGLLALFQ